VANPGRYNINVINGTTFNLTTVWKINAIPVIMTGYSADLQVRDVSNNLITEMSTANGKATITGSAGKVSCDLTAAQTNALTAGTYNYALNVTDAGGTVTQLLNGTFLVAASVVQ